MSKREDEAYAAWLEEIEASLPSEDAVEAFKVLAETDAGRDLYRGTLREKDYYTKLNKLNADREEVEKAQEELTEWYENEQAIKEQIIKERDALRKAAGEQPQDGPPNQQVGISPEEFAVIRAKAAKVDAIDKLLPRVLGDLGAVLQDAQKNGYDVDAREIMQASVQSGVDPYNAYLKLTGKQREERAKQALEDQQKKWYEEGRRAALSGDAPDHVQPAGPNVYDMLTAPEKEGTPSVAQQSQGRVSDAVRAFREGDF